MRYFYLGIFAIVASGCVGLVSGKEIKENRAIEVSSDTISLIFAGDLMCHYPQVQSAFRDSVFQFDNWFEHLKPIISAADLAFVNLETTLRPKGPYRGYPRFKSPESLGKAVADAGFDVVVTANNHSNDSGLDGVSHTIDVLNRLGLHHTGTFKSSLDKAVHYPLVFEYLGLKIAVLNYSYDTNGIPTAPPSVVNLIDTVQIKSDIDKARSLQPDLLIAFMHWGREYQTQPSTQQRALAQMMIDLGVDHIIGAHPHVVQPVELIQHESETHLVAYSLGNFISNQNKKYTDGGVMVKLRLLKKDQKVTLIDWNYIPVWRYKYRALGKTEYRIIPTLEYHMDTSYFQSRSHFNEMKSYHDYIEDHME